VTHFCHKTNTTPFGVEELARGIQTRQEKLWAVLDARAYTIPIEQAVQRVRTGETPEFTKREMHKRLVYAVAEEGGGFVLTSGVTGEGNKQILEYRCQLESNPEFTANVLVACARAAFRLCKEGRKGAFTMLDIPPGYLSPCKEGRKGAFTMLDIPPGYLSPHSAEILRKSFM
jgi:diaminopimelate dehydrogenase